MNTVQIQEILINIRQLEYKKVAHKLKNSIPLALFLQLFSLSSTNYTNTNLYTAHCIIWVYFKGETNIDVLHAVIQETKTKTMTLLRKKTY